MNDPNETPATQPGAPPERPPSIVVLDDRPDLVRLVAEILQINGFGCQPFVNPIEALRLIVSFPPDLVIVDLDMPVMSGLEVCEEIHRALPGQAPPIIMLSAADEEALITQAYEIGVTDYIAKPVRPGLLLAKVRSALGQIARRLRVPSPQRAPSRVGPWLIESELGRGGMGVVYRARSVDTDRVVALKTCWPSPREREDLLRFRREIEILQSLRHPNLIHVYDAGRQAEIFYFAMELIEGKSLHDFIANGPVPETQTRRMLGTLAGALDVLHGRGLVHRDVKPGNILLDATRGPILSDFGLARRLDDSQVTATDRAIGTPSYMSPEMIHGTPIDGRADLFALGLVGVEMLTGDIAVPGSNPFFVMNAVTSGTFPRGAELVASELCSPGLGAILDDLLELDPDARPPSGAEVQSRIVDLPALT